LIARTEARRKIYGIKLSRLALLRSAFSLLLGRLHLAPEIEASRVESLTVNSRRRRLR
jgi:hypothetical protein